MKRILKPMTCGLAALWLLTLPLGSAAALTAEGAGEDTQTEEAWDARLEQLHKELLVARGRVAKAVYAYQDWRQRKYPRGAKKADLLEEIDLAKSDLADLEAAWPESLEKARRAGAPREVLRRYEELPAASSED